MKIVKYNTLNPIDEMINGLGRGWFPSVHNVFRSQPGWDETEAVRMPRTNINETEDSFVFTMELPGLTKKDVEVSIEKDVLVVKGERTEKHEEKGMLRREIRSTRYERSFTLDGSVEQDKIKAQLENGLLTVTLPKKPEKVGRKVDVS